MSITGNSRACRVAHTVTRHASIREIESLPNLGRRTSSTGRRAISSAVFTNNAINFQPPRVLKNDGERGRISPESLST